MSDDIADRIIVAPAKAGAHFDLDMFDRIA